jgi:two-component system, OmpR family, response regulator
MNDNKMSILLCEDDENLGMLLREYLQAKGYETTLCTDGDAGYKAFLKDKFDLCVLDVMMPKKDGFTLAKDIRQNSDDTPIIFLTAKTLKEDVLEGFKIGADDYLTKPFSMEELTMRIEAILRRAQKIKQFTFFCCQLRHLITTCQNLFLRIKSERANLVECAVTVFLTTCATQNSLNTHCKFLHRERLCQIVICTNLETL